MLHCYLWKASMVTEDKVLLLSSQWSPFIPVSEYLVAAVTKIASSDQFIVCKLFLNALL